MATGKILIVDDDTNICELLRLYIEKEGYEASMPPTATASTASGCISGTRKV